MRKYMIVIAATVILMACLCGVPLHYTTDMTVDKAPILIDPGHGGVDGGTSSADGTQEKQVNLAIGLRLHDLLTVCGFDVDLTRQTDISIHSEDSHTIREKKVSDMHNRLAMYQQASLVVAIHQNHFPSGRYRGGQIFYSANHADSQLLAGYLQESLRCYLQPDNSREIKRATDSIYLLHHANRPAVLVECGFLSNEEESALLKQSAYQQQVALTLLAGIINYKMENNSD